MDKTVILQPRAKEWSWCYHSCLSKSIDKHTSKGLLLLNQVTSTTIETSFSGSEEIRLWSELVIMYKFNSFRCGKNEPFLNKSIKQNLGFSAISVGKESTCNAGDPVRFLGQEDSLGWIGYPSQYSWTYLVAQLVKNLPAMWETWVCSLGWEDLLEKGKAIHSSILDWKMDYKVHGVAKSQTWLSNFHFHFGCSE